MYDVKQSIMMQTLLSDADKRTCRIISKRLNGIKNDYEKRLKCSKSSRIDFYNKTNKQKFWKLIKKNMRPKMIIPISIDEIKTTIQGHFTDNLVGNSVDDQQLSAKCTRLFLNYVPENTKQFDFSTIESTIKSLSNGTAIGSFSSIIM